MSPSIAGEKVGDQTGALREAGQHDLSAPGDAAHQIVQQPTIAGGVVDRAIVAARVVGGVHHLVAHGAAPAGRIALPDGGRVLPQRHREARQETAQRPVPDDELGGTVLQEGQDVVVVAHDLLPSQTAAPSATPSRVTISRARCFARSAASI